MVTIMYAQKVLTTEGQTFTNSEDTWLGVNIPREVPTKLIFKNNSITSKNRFGYMLQAGDEARHPYNNHLDGAVITGNRLSWSGEDMEVIPHGLFTGHNINVVIKYNYLNYVPMGIIRKSATNMKNTGGGVAYNIVKGGAVAMVVKGMSNVNIYNNTFYTDRTPEQTWRPLLHIYTNTDPGVHSVSQGTKVYNNIFYTKYQTFAITVEDEESLAGLECDYNLYWSESGSPIFNVNGVTKTFEDWQAMGFDKHSVIANPNFKDLVNFAPSARLDYGKDLGQEWVQGLAVNAKWGSTDPATVSQNGRWQVGAVILQSETGPSDANDINIYPNPAKKHFNISDVSEGTVVELKMFDVSGRLQMKETLNSDFLRNIPIDLTPGVYLLSVKVGEEPETIHRLIVIR
jgi:hypothetical protein